ncbi:pyridoxamine 5'-phosphate oxidase family protein [Pseudooceanicola algae]|uniref:General stress protein FMN-binding split barrel domain-containing protein n=1 Tax=Pseudooceanicola algae TaxID=1537215 RepID=A0A418SGV9_9RHOB|nr:pyridoxamine 5'-phosphate oxidase family protein [Pseudooceanicola algae]QPM88854.1 hypothetical protein PSAL_000570 [Pseudooceanicola algae]
MKDHQTRTETAETFWKRMEDVTAGMLLTEAHDFVPMSHQVDPEAGMLWFITSKGTTAHKAAMEKRDSHFLVAERDAKIYAHVSGTLSEVNDPAKLDEIWSRVAAAWFEEGREDPDVRLIGLRPANAEIWFTDGGAKFLYEMAKSVTTDATPDLGSHEHLTF